MGVANKGLFMGLSVAFLQRTVPFLFELLTNRFGGRDSWHSRWYSANRHRKKGRATDPSLIRHHECNRGWSELEKARESYPFKV